MVLSTLSPRRSGIIVICASPSGNDACFIVMARTVGSSLDRTFHFLVFPCGQSLSSVMGHTICAEKKAARSTKLTS